MSEAEAMAEAVTTPRKAGSRKTGSRKAAAALLLVAIGFGATACEFGQHRGSHSNVYPEEGRSYQRPYEPEYRPAY
jgi:uncharacterized protein HemX